MLWKPSAICANTPPFVTPTPGGMVSPSMICWISWPTAWVSSDVMLPVMDADLVPSVRVIVTGPLVSTTDAISLTGLDPSGPEIIMSPIDSRLLMLSVRAASTTSTG